MAETSLQLGEGEQEGNYSLAFYCSYIILLWMFPTTAVAPSLPSITFHCGVDFGSHRFRDTWQNITEWLIFSCAMTMEVQRQTCACRFCLCVKPGILPSFHSQFSRTKEGPDLKAGFLKHQIFKYT